MLDFVCLLVFTYAKKLNGFLTLVINFMQITNFSSVSFYISQASYGLLALLNTFFPQLFFKGGKKKYRDSTRLLPIPTINGHGRQRFTNPVRHKKMNPSLSTIKLWCKDWNTL